MDQEQQERLEKIRESKRKYAQKARARAKQEGALTKSDKKRETLRIIKQTIAGGNTHIDKLMKNEITLSSLNEYCVQNNCDLRLVQPHILEFLQNTPIQSSTTTSSTIDPLDSIFTIETFSKTRKSPYTIKNYLSHLSVIKELLHVSSNTQFVDLLAREPDKISDIIHRQYQDNSIPYISAIIFLIRNFDTIKTLVPESTLKYYLDNMKDLRDEYADLKMIHPDGLLSWDQIVSLRTKISDSDRYGLYHLLISLYTCVPPLRDDYGLVKLVPSFKDTNKEDNFYVIDTNMFYFNHYKTVSKYKPFNFIVPRKLQEVILGSLKRNPRSYLITKNYNFSDVPYKDGKLTNIIPKIFKIDHNNGLTINDFRHSFETYIGEYNIDFSLAEKRQINRIMGHNSDQRDFYIRENIRSKPLFKQNINEQDDIVQRISDKIGGFYDIGDKLIFYRPPPPIQKIKITLKNQPQ
jgi:hypothetical protein